MPVDHHDPGNEARRALDHVAIERLFGAYADVVNRRAFDELAELFLPTCEVSIDVRRSEPIVATGATEFGAFVGPAMERFDFFEFVILSSRTWIGDDDEARGRLYMCELRQDRETGRRSQAFGVYDDQFCRVDGRWWFSARRYHTLARTPASGDGPLEVFEFPTI